MRIAQAVEHDLDGVAAQIDRFAPEVKPVWRNGVNTEENLGMTGIAARGPATARRVVCL